MPSIWLFMSGQGRGEAGQGGTEQGKAGQGRAGPGRAGQGGDGPGGDGQGRAGLGGAGKGQVQLLQPLHAAAIHHKWHMHAMNKLWVGSERLPHEHCS